MSSDSPEELHPLVQGMDLLVAGSVFVGVVVLAGRGTALEMRALWPLGAVAAGVWPLGLQLVSLERARGRQGLAGPFGRLAVVALLAVLVEPAAAFLLRAPVPRWLPLVSAGAQGAALAGLRGLTAGWVASLRRGAHRVRNVLIAGSGPRAAYVADVIARNPAWGLRVVGFVDRREGLRPIAVPGEQLFDPSSIDELLCDQVIDEMIVACPRSKLDGFLPVVDRATAAGVPITLLSDIFGDLLPAPRVERFGTLPALSFAPVHHPPAALAVKRLLDIAGASLGLLLAAPILAAAALAIKSSSPGPVLFRQVRCSLHGRHFVMPKLRTMALEAEGRREELEARNEMDGPVFKIREDPRVTRIGRLLRRTSLDELPQLWSVLKGDMSLVGPRPPLPVEVAAYRTFERRRLSMRPGLTCLWQVSGRNEIGFEDWVRLDLEYIDTWSLAGDLRILARTLPAVLTGRGAS